MMCGHDYDSDGTYMGLPAEDAPDPQTVALRQKARQAYLNQNSEEEAWLEFELAQHTRSLVE